MAGYNGYSMSNNAIDAYESGEKPLSKWNKSNLLAAINEVIENDEIEINFTISFLSKLPVKALKDLLLYCSSWHHTSSHYNETDFYSINSSVLEELNDTQIAELKTAAKTEKTILPETSEIWECEYLVWSGTRNHLKADTVQEIGEIKGNWFYLKNGSKKSVKANGFKRIRKSSLEEREQRELQAKKEREEYNEKRDLFAYQNKYKTLNGFIKSEPDFNALREIRKNKIAAKRQELMANWKNLPQDHWILTKVDDDSFIESYIKNKAVL